VLAATGNKLAVEVVRAVFGIDVFVGRYGVETAVLLIDARGAKEFDCAR
jgi:hypothetical protein